MGALESERLELQQKIDGIEAWLETLESVLASLTNQVANLEKAVGKSNPTPAPLKKLTDLLTRKSLSAIFTHLRLRRVAALPFFQITYRRRWVSHSAALCASRPSLTV